jgi:hypothetical protein
MVALVAAGIITGGKGEDRMSGRARLPGGGVRRASQRRSRPAAVSASVTVAAAPRWKHGDRIVWRGCGGEYLRDVEDGQAHVLIGARTYLVQVGELRPA